MMKRLTALYAIGLLSACGSGQDKNSGVTAKEAEALNETEQMLDQPAETGELPVTSEAAIN